MIIENGLTHHEPVTRAPETEEERRERLSEQAWQEIIMWTDDPEIQECALYMWVGIPTNIAQEVSPNNYNFGTIEAAVRFVEQNLSAVKQMVAIAEERGILPFDLEKHNQAIEQARSKANS